MPLVYTMAGDKAVSVNAVNRLSLIPLGVFADEGCEYTLTFLGVETLEAPNLLDTYENTETPLTEGLTMDMEGASHGRYFIRTNGATDIDEAVHEANSVFSPRRKSSGRPYRTALRSWHTAPSPICRTHQRTPRPW